MSEIESVSSDPAAAVVPFDFAASVFRLPALLRNDPHYVALYEDFARRLQHDASGLSLNTLQVAIIERIASGYVIMRWHEDYPNSWVGLNTEKDFVQNWRGLVSEFNRALASGEDKRRDALKVTYQNIMLGALDLIKDTELKKLVLAHLVTQFTTIGE